MNSGLKKAWKIVSTILVILVLLLAIMLVGVRIIGIHPYYVLSGSMEPEYPVGSLIYVQPVDYTELEVGDVVTYVLNEDGAVSTHRIVEVIPDEDDPGVIRYKTKGDANDVEDGALLHYKNIIGSPVATIPYLGYVANFIQNPPGTYIALAAAGIILVLVFVPDMFKDDKKDGEDKDKKEKKSKKEKKEATEGSHAK